MHRARIGPWLLWLAILAAVTVVLHSVRDELDQAHVVLVYLLVVLGGSVGGGRALGLTLACVEFLLIDYYFQLPYDLLSAEKPLDWVVLAAFLATAAVTTNLLARASAEAAAARRRADEVASFARLGSETLSAGRAEDALVAIATVVRDTLVVLECEIYDRRDGRVLPILAARAPGPETETTGAARGLVAWVAESGRAAVLCGDGSRVEARSPPTETDVLSLEPADARAIAVPLVAHTRTVGVLLAADRQPMRLDPPKRRFLAALAYYAALGVERVRLVAEAEHAEALREADRLKDVLLASVSHDLRTPLTTIKALAHSAALRGERDAGVIEEQADRLGRMVSDLLDLSRIRSGAFPLQLEPNTAEDLIGAVARQVGGLLDGRRLATVLDLDQPALVGRFDFVQSLRVLTNLVENAIRYGPPNEPIELGARRENGFLTFTVADRGPGVPADDRERIFEPFYRAADALPDAGHAGLGLSIARRLAEVQGGSVLYDARPGGGSVFALRLPALDLSDAPDA